LTRGGQGSGRLAPLGSGGGISAGAFELPLELSPLVDPSVWLVQQMESGRLEGIVLKDRTSTYRDRTRVGWSKVKDRSWYDREAWRFDRR
jgi:hypothetical protein